MSTLGPRLIVAGTHSGVGKTTVATGLLAALRRAGHRVAGAKVGPDYIDPGYHSLASLRPPRNLDPWICGADALVRLAARAGADSDMLVIEGVMGLFDGATDGSTSSTADVARLLDAPVVLVVDVAAIAGSVAAVVHGFASLDPVVRLAGVVLNRIGSEGHAVQLREALVPLGIPVPPPGERVRVGVATGSAFTFLYSDTTAALVAGGAELVPFDPLVDRAVPSSLDGLLVGGGFPEVHAAALADNVPLLVDVARRIGDGLVTWAECGGLLWLCQSLDGYPMAGLLPAAASMTDRLTLGYRSAVTTAGSPLGPVGTAVRGHEFHYSNVEPSGDALKLTSRWGTARAGFASPSLLATFLHHHPGGDPSAIAAFLTACRAKG